MKQCDSVTMRNTMSLVNQLKRMRIDFVPVPVLDALDKEKFLALLADRIEDIEESAVCETENVSRETFSENLYENEVLSLIKLHYGDFVRSVSKNSRCGVFVFFTKKGDSSIHMERCEHDPWPTASAGNFTFRRSES